VVKRSTDRILTTHVGSLARPHPLLELMRPKAAGEDYDAAAFARLAAEAVDDVVRQQAEAGIDVVSDGEQSKAGFFAYVAERLSGLEPDTIGVPDRAVWKGELDRFPEYYREYLGGKAQSMIRNRPLVCTGPISYQGQAASRHRQPAQRARQSRRGGGVHAVDRSAQSRTQYVLPIG
jgi:5-methyltetrahydropteroyltriglutamate--homocysteine methyltransferase